MVEPEDAIDIEGQQLLSAIQTRMAKVHTLLTEVDYLRHDAKMMLALAWKYGRELESAPNLLPSGWAALLYLYRLR
jgi:hypothetical protein